MQHQRFQKLSSSLLLSLSTPNTRSSPLEPKSNSCFYCVTGVILTCLSCFLLLPNQKFTTRPKKVEGQW
ncbi:hypothetical protein MANES_03G082762v8 [Manihot esculenta]|uniref:Uncharacterized protein n=1 Tax=Manihot esculenta TaxID=3983 RepID=A0ACB7HXS3_MANES|nr:hypothetical protein MANES_03G082762v8 [Manihot esculenta]